MTAEPKPPLLIANTTISDNTSAPSNTEKPWKEIPNHGNSVSDLDEERLSVLINSQAPDTQHETGSPIVTSEGFPLRQLLLMKDVVKVRFVLKQC